MLIRCPNCQHKYYTSTAIIVTSTGAALCCPTCTEIIRLNEAARFEVLEVTIE